MFLTKNNHCQMINYLITMAFMFLVEYLVENTINGTLIKFYKILAYYIDLSLVHASPIQTALTNQDLLKINRICVFSL